MSGRKAAASPSGELKSAFDSADSELAICCQHKPIATGATVPTVCQPVNPIERVALSHQDIHINDFIDRGAKNEKLNHTDFDLRLWVALELLWSRFIAENSRWHLQLANYSST
jgi:hypothetical protein